MTTTPMPVEISKALNLVMQSIGRLSNDSRNDHGKYNYTSVDAFLAATGPACSEAGLIIKPVQVAYQREIIEVYDSQIKQMKPKRIAAFSYKFRLVHAPTGTTWTDDEDVRHIELDYTGPQTFQAAESFVLKAYERTLFQIPTGDPDADAQEQHQAEIIRATVKAHKVKTETGSEQVLLDFGNGLEPLPAADVSSRVMQHLVALGDKDAATDWWQHQKHGREQFHNQFPRLALDLKRKVEGFLANGHGG